VIGTKSCVRLTRARANLVVFACALAIVGCGYAVLAIGPHLIYNSTPSLPRGWYWASPITGTIRRGALAFVCPPSPSLDQIRHTGQHFVPGNCPGGVAPFLKIVVGVPGDRVAVLPRGIEINGRVLTHSKPVTALPLPRPTPTTVGAHEVWVWSPIAASVDSRYFGAAVPIAIGTPLGRINDSDQRRLVPAFEGKRGE
jgi:conjugative transfer signal peptidase TraF